MAEGSILEAIYLHHLACDYPECRARHKPGVWYLHDFAMAKGDGSRWSKNEDTGPMSGERCQVRLIIDKKAICAFSVLLAYCRP